MGSLNPSNATDQEIKKYLDEAPQGFTVPETISLHRHSICNECIEKVSILSIDQCKICNCIIKLKVKLTHTNCPMNKW